MSANTPSIPARILLAFLRFYQFAISPLMHGIMRLLAPAATNCKFLPTCSEYARQAIEIHGAVRGSRLAAQRLSRCHPFSRGGADPVPLPAAMQTSSRDFPPDHLP
jgi:putative membrane protein insertion efficiency factor